MTDLCKNCGCCHLGVDPSPCALPLKSCDTCKQMGHGTQFCPRGVIQSNGQPGPLASTSLVDLRARTDMWQYYMICSNCDRWHLPVPCQIPLQQCRQCGYYGHMPSYCPVAPVPNRPLRAIAQPLPPSRPPDDSRKRQRQDDDENRRLMVTLPLRVLDEKHVHPMLMATIHQGVWTRVARLLLEHTRDDLLATLTRGVPLPSTGGSFRPETRPAITNNGAIFEGGGVLQGPSQHPPTMKPSKLATSPATEHPGGVPVTPLTTQKSKQAVQQDQREEKANIQARQYRENFEVGGFNERPPSLEFQTTGTGAAGHQYSAQNARQQQTWLLNTAAGPLDTLASAAEQVTARADPALFTFPGRGQGLPGGERYEEPTHPMDFSQLLNSDPAAGPVHGSEQYSTAAQLRAELGEDAAVQSSKKRGGRKKKA